MIRIYKTKAHEIHLLYLLFTLWFKMPHWMVYEWYFIIYSNNMPTTHIQWTNISGWVLLFEAHEENNWYNNTNRQCMGMDKNSENDYLKMVY